MTRRIGKVIVLGSLVLFLTSCGKSQSTHTVDSTEKDVSIEIVEDTVAGDTEESELSTDVVEEYVAADGIDVDLTILSSTMVYSEVYNMMMVPEEYIGKTVKMNGSFSVFQNQETQQLYFACIVSDATACCAQGIEFELAGDYTYPDDYPDMESNITVTGVFETYEEDGYTYCRLKDAEMELPYN